MKYYTTKLGKFCSENENWEEVLSNPPYNLKINRDGDYVIFNYNQINSDFSNEIVREARGIIFREGQWQGPVCHAFDKFGNYGETYVPEIDWDSAVVTEKVDGSLIKIWYDERWHISTNGTINAFKAEMNNVKFQTYGDLFLQCFNMNSEDRVVGFFFNIHPTGELLNFLESLNKNYTYMFELVGPYNRVVIPYKETKLYFLGLRNEDGMVKPFHQCPAIVTKMRTYGVDTPKVYHLRSLEQCIEATQELPWDEEGYVVDDIKGNRVKIKSPAYVTAHYVRTTRAITERVLIQIILSNEIEEFLIYAEDYREELFSVKRAMEVFELYHEICLEEIKDKDFINRKEFAFEVQKYPIYVRPYLFLNFDRTITFKEYTENWSVEKWEEMINNNV